MENFVVEDESATLFNSELRVASASREQHSARFYFLIKHSNTNFLYVVVDEVYRKFSSRIRYQA